MAKSGNKRSGHAKDEKRLAKMYTDRVFLDLDIRELEMRIASGMGGIVKLANRRAKILCIPPPIPPKTKK